MARTMLGKWQSFLGDLLSNEPPKFLKDHIHKAFQLSPLKTGTIPGETLPEPRLSPPRKCNSARPTVPGTSAAKRVLPVFPVEIPLALPPLPTAPRNKVLRSTGAYAASAERLAAVTWHKSGLEPDDMPECQVPLARLADADVAVWEARVPRTWNVKLPNTASEYDISI